MGLDTSHGCWHGAYSSFSRWRDKLTRVAGYTMTNYVEDGIPYVAPAIDWEKYHRNGVDGPLMGHWEETPEDALLVIIVHSDCEGWIFHPQTKPLADRLTELLPLLPDEDAGGHVGYWREKTQTFIDGLLAAHEAGEDVDFH